MTTYTILHKGEKRMSRTIYVSKHNTSEHEFSTITDALLSIPKGTTEPVTIYIKKGTYKEKLVIKQPNLTLIGESKEETILTFDDYANMIMEDGSKRGTFRTPSVFIDANDFTAKNLTFQNSSGFGHQVGQALALYVDGDRMIFDNCILLGSQDTLFTAPLPPTANQPGGFTGPKEFEPRINGRHYYRNCYIRGDVDFIFGSATAFFDHCEIFSQKTDDLPAAKEGEEQKNYGYVTAASTAEDQKYGYVFSHCRLTSDCPKHSVYLGRPWRNFAKTVFLHCEIGKHIREEGWHDWNKPEAHETMLYAEYQSTGEGAKAIKEGKRASFSKQLSNSEALNYTVEKVLAGDDNWGANLSLTD